MNLLILGVVLWTLVHLMKRLAPDFRARLGDKKAPGVVAIGVLISIIFMVIGFRAAEVIPVWEPPEVLFHVNKLLILIAIFLMSPAPKKGALLNGMRHPMLTGFVLWAVAHLLVNGDIASIVLFGGLTIWALASMMIINRAEPEWHPHPKGKITMDAVFLFAAAVLHGLIGFVHSLVGPSVF